MPGVLGAELITTIESSLPDAAGGSLTGSVGSAGGAGGSLTGSVGSAGGAGGSLTGSVRFRGRRGRFAHGVRRFRGRRGRLAHGVRRFRGRFRGRRGRLAHGVRHVRGRFRGRRGGLAHRLGNDLGARNTRVCQADEGHHERGAEMRRLRRSRHRVHSPFAPAPGSLGWGETPVGLATDEAYSRHDWKGQSTPIPKQMHPTCANQISHALCSSREPTEVCRVGGSRRALTARYERSMIPRAFRSPHRVSAVGDELP